MWTPFLALCAASVLAQSQYGENHVAVNKDSQVVEQTAFPAPDATIYSPAFLPNASFDPGWSKGAEGATSLDKLSERSDICYHCEADKREASFVSALAARNPSWMSVGVADFLSEEGNPFPYIHLSKSNNTSGTDSNTGKIRVWIQGSVHGKKPWCAAWLI